MVVGARIPTGRGKIRLWIEHAGLMKIERPPTHPGRIDSQQTTDMVAMMPPMSGAAAPGRGGLRAAAVHRQKQGKDSRWMAPTERSAEQWQRRSATLSAAVYSSLYCVLVALATASASSFSSC